MNAYKTVCDIKLLDLLKNSETVPETKDKKF